ncbi:MAG TPA: FGGY family carbohydrate kinase [Bauldia sp.]|nr:FGGY family carbohydrate kinase [Bauldia sp.]
MTGRVLVLDVGTSALKAVLFDRAGSVVASAEAGYGPPPGPHRQSVDAWWRAARQAIAGLPRHPIEAIALTGTMENLIAVDAAGRPVHDAILYSDPCGAAALESLAPALLARRAGEILGNPPEPLMSAFKLHWLQAHAPVHARRARWFLPGAKDALLLRLTGRAVTDPVTAATTGLMDLRNRAWSPVLIEALSAPPDRLPAILPAAAIVGEVTPEAAADLGFSGLSAIPVINGCGDAGATTLGSWCREEGDVSLYLGTSGWVARVVPDREFAPDPSVYRLAHPRDGLLIEITPILSAGAAGNWVRDLLAIPAAERDALLAEADRNPEELVFLPYLVGERFPFFDANVRAAFVGLDTAHRREHLYYAVLEGVGLAIRANLAALDPGGTAEIRLAGGGATSAIWPRLLADLLGRSVTVPDDPENATALGAFLVAADALRLSVAAARSHRVVSPREDRRQRTARLGRAFDGVTRVARQLVR